MNKVIATDLDGTLFYPKDKRRMISKKNLYFVQSFIDNGGKFVVVSGRSHAYGLKVKKVIDRDIDIISFNGGSIYKGDEIIYAQSLDNKEVESLINDIFTSYKIFSCLIFTDRGTYIRGKKKDSKFTFFFGKIYMYSQGAYAEEAYFSKGEYEKALKNEKIYKILILFGITPKAKKRAMETNKVIRNTYKNIEASWVKNCIEITPKNISKGDAVKKYCEYCGYNEDDIYVVGDSGNDISMFKVFNKHSFVMGHASNIIKKYARYILNKYEDLSRYIYEK